MIREIHETELVELLNLYTQLHDNSIPPLTNNIKTIWSNIINDKNHHIIVAIEKNKIVSSCVCVIIPNLTHNQRPYAIIENVITDIKYREKGYASSCLEFAKEMAINENCYKMMLLTGSKKDSILQFYKKAGYSSNDKTGFIQWL